MKQKMIIVICLLSFGVKSQNNIGIKFFGLNIHPKLEKENAQIMPLKLDSNGVLVLNLGGEIMYEHFVYEDRYSVKFVQALYSDCASKLGGFTHLGIRGRILKRGKHSLYGGIGPTFVFRENWLNIPEYKDQGLYKGGKERRYQSFFIWYGGEFEYKYRLNNRMDFAISFIPGYPDLLNLSLGMSYRLSKYTF